jgi:glycosyltransferase involved in cell wall biosynthesis
MAPAPAPQTPGRAVSLSLRPSYRTTVPPPEPVRVVVVTPIRNEAWILERFLSVTSRFADQIIIADQRSTDDSRAICSRYPKVRVIDNPTDEFNERDRQLLLLRHARAMVPLPRIILALDADEILAANAVHTPSWRTMLAAPPGTILCPELVDLYETPDQCMRHDRHIPVGYVDDGAEHAPRDMHSVRVPIPDYAHRLVLPDIKLLHYSALRPTALAAKLRWYSVLENVRGTCPWVFKRRLRYAMHIDFTGAGRLERCSADWFRGWEDAGIDMRSAPEEKYYWYDFEVLRHMKAHGTRKFWLDDIWRFDWEACRLHAKGRHLPGVPDDPVRAPPRVLVLAMRVLSALHRLQRRLRHRVTGRSGPRFA